MKKFLLLLSFYSLVFCSTSYKVIRENVFKWNGSNWIYEMREYNTYNQGGTANIQSKIKYIYNSSGQLTSTRNYSPVYNDDTYNFIYSYHYWYNYSYDYIDESFTYNYQGVNLKYNYNRQWGDAHDTGYEDYTNYDYYYENGNLSSIHENSSAFTSLTTEFFYNEQGRVYYSESSSYGVDWYRTNWTYMADSTIVINEKCEYGSWQNFEKRIQYYDVNGNVAIEMIYKWENGDWVISKKKNYVYQEISTYFSGSGTVEEPYAINSLQDLQYLSSEKAFWTSHFIQTADLDMSASKDVVVPIGNSTTKFTGSYDGQGYTINGLNISLPTTYRVGLFGNTLDAEIKNVELTNVNISGYISAGALVGYSENTDIINCHTSGYVSGTNNIGGLVGYNYNGSSISNSSSSCSVYGTNYIAGLSGYNTTNCTISECYSTGTVTGTDYVGGLVGRNNNTSVITDSYAKGVISGAHYTGGLLGLNSSYSTVHNCYAASEVTGTEYYNGGAVAYNDLATSAVVENVVFDSEVSGYGSGQGCIARTTAQMKDIATYTVRTWDFVGESVNGMDDYWNISGFNNDGYPFLSWQTFPSNVPQSVTITPSGSDIVIGWEANPQATSYTVYSSTDPYAAFPSGWTLETNVTGTDWTDTNATVTKKFYIIVSSDAKKDKIENKEIKVVGRVK